MKLHDFLCFVKPLTAKITKTVNNRYRSVYILYDSYQKYMKKISLRSLSNRNRFELIFWLHKGANNPIGKHLIFVAGTRRAQRDKLSLYKKKLILKLRNGFCSEYKEDCHPN